jgi:hypothetical protein
MEKDIAEYIKKEFDKNHGPTWHCIVGRNFGNAHLFLPILLRSSYASVCGGCSSRVVASFSVAIGHLRLISYSMILVKWRMIVTSDHELLLMNIYLQGGTE